MKRRGPRRALGLALILLPQLADAASGIVLYFPSGCDYFVLESDAGMALMSVAGDVSPVEGDVLVGTIDSRGPARLENYVSGETIEVEVEDYWLSEDAAIDRYLEYCEPPPAL